MDRILTQVGKQRPAVLPFVVRQLRVWFRNPVFNEDEGDVGGGEELRFLRFDDADGFLSGPIPELLFNAAKRLNLTLEYVNGFQQESYRESNFSQLGTIAKSFLEDVSHS